MTAVATDRQLPYPFKRTRGIIGRVNQGTPTYREPGSVGNEAETLAFYELRERIKALQARALFLPTAIGAALGVAGMIAHVTGYWSVLGTLSTGGYYVNGVTVLIALLSPALPCMLGGYISYRAVKPFTIRRWRAEASRKHGLSREALDDCARGA